MTRPLALVVLVGCGGKGCGSGGGGPKDLSYEDAAVPGVGSVAFEGCEGQAHVEWRVDGGEWMSSASVPAEEGTIPVYGLPLGQAVELKVVCDDGGDESDPLSATVAAAPAGLPAYTQTVWEPGESCMDGGYFMFGYIGQTNGVVIIDRDGTYVWATVNDVEKTGISRARPGRDGKSILWNLQDEERVADLGQIVRLSLDGSERTETRTKNAHHDFYELPDGRMAWLGYGFGDRVWPGSPWGDEPQPSAWDILYVGEEGETDADAATIVFETAADYEMYTNPGLAEFFLTIDTNGNGVQDDGENDQYREFGHGNSLAYSEADDAFYLMWRWTDTFLKIDHATGDVIWEFGGPNHSFPNGDPDELFLHGHMSDRWGDSVLIFDNHDVPEGSAEPQGSSRIAEYVLDPAGETFERTMFQEATISEAGYDALGTPENQREVVFEKLLGDVRRMPVEGCDNVLMVLTDSEVLQERTRDGKIVWEVVNTGAAAGRPTRAFFLPTLYDFGEYAYWETD